MGFIWETYNEFEVAGRIMARFSAYALNKFLAPGVSDFDHAEIPDMSSKSSAWLAKYFLNSLLRQSYQEGTQQYVFNYLRRVEAAFAQHEVGKQVTTEFLAGSRQAISMYMKALFHWESFVAQSWQAYALLMAPSKTKFFDKNDGSTAQRLNLLYNRSKHAESAIAAGQVPEDGTLPLWMTNDGLQCVDASLSWHETGEILMDLSKYAHILEDPHTAKNKLRTEVGDA